jgi:hypothetical protein
MQSQIASWQSNYHNRKVGAPQCRCVDTTRCEGASHCQPVTRRTLIKDEMQASLGCLQIQEGSDVATAAAGLAPELLTKTLGVGNLAFFKAEDAQYF